MTRNRKRYFWIASVLFILCARTSVAQIVPESFSVGFGLGIATYFGEFNSFAKNGPLDIQIGNDMEFGMKYTFNKYFSLGFIAGRIRTPYAVSDDARSKYFNSFFGPVGDPTYPATPLTITPSNTIRMSRYQLMADGYLAPSWQWTPFVTVGVAYSNFSTTNGGDTLLPTNLTGEYKTNTWSIPFGGGFQIAVSKDAWLYIRGLVYMTMTDYLDGYAHYLDYEQQGFVPTGPGTTATPNDYVASLTIGVAGILFRADPPRTDDPPPVADRPPEVIHDTVQADPVPSNARTEFAGIYFRQNTDDFDLSRPETVKNLKSLLDYMKMCDSLRVLVEGHSSSEGDPKRNKQLSALRARRIREWLILNGIDPAKILGTVGYGYGLPKEKEPDDSEVSAAELEEIRKQNRRITVLVRKMCDEAPE